MENTAMEQMDLIAYGQRVLKQYKNNYFLSGIETKPVLSETGNIENMEEFIEIKKNTHPVAGCDTPLEKISSVSPQAVATILEGIHAMDASLTEKQLLFDVYIERSQSPEDVSDELLNKASISFAKAYNDEDLENSVRRS